MQDKWNQQKMDNRGIIHHLQNSFNHCEDIVFKKIVIKEFPITLIYAEYIIDPSFIDKYIMPKLDVVPWGLEKFDEYLMKEIQLENMTGSKEDEIQLKILNGYILIHSNHSLFAASANSVPKRTPEEPATEPSIRGPRDGLIEDLGTNIALIRKRLKSNELKVEKFIIGKRSNTTIAIVYVNDIINKELLSTVKKKINQIEVDVVSSIQQIEAVISDQPYALIPSFDTTGRPDFAVDCLNQGKFLLLMDGQPTASIAPVQIANLFKSPEDANLNFVFVSFERLLRFFSLFISILLPGTWVALTTHNIEQIPFLLVATVSVNRYGIPLSTPFEMLLMLILFELFNEAGLRLPRGAGQTVSVLGGLIIGDAAIRAGITSPPILIMGALTFISGFTLVNQTLSTSVTLFRFLIFFLGAMFGIFGVVLGFLLIISYLVSLTSIGVPFMAMTYPFHLSNIIRSFLKEPWKIYKTRGSLASPEDRTRQED
ncbi:spore germination protein [Neobacillus rhizosphaerae]|uniref:spore germination protein n=1 Tax=Neobacillus rhizosphaerae TaxID=2880965 RepID=UPI003D2E8A68